MKNTIVWLIGGLLLSLSPNATAATRYVNVSNSTPTAPYTDWVTAATNIQDAVDLAVAGDQILVTNGTYAVGGRAVYGTLTNRVAVDKPLTLRSVNGPDVTIILGQQVSGTTNGDGAIRCAYLADGATLAGFTLTNGATRRAGDYDKEQTGGGVWCLSTSSVVSNCLLVGNSANNNSGGASLGTLINCTLKANSTAAIDSFGGGAAGSILNACTLVGNSASYGGGMDDGILNNCTLNSNWASSSGGGACSATLNNCALSGNSAPFGGGAYDSTLNNCTLTGNSAEDGGGTCSSALYNCIVRKGSNRRLVPPQRGGLGLFFDGFLCLTWGGYPDTLAPCRAPCEWNILARSIM